MSQETNSWSAETTPPTSIDDSLQVTLPPVTNLYHRRTTRYYHLSPSEIENLSNIGWMETIALTLVGVFAGFASGCVVAILQSGLSESSKGLLIGLAVMSGIFTLIMIGFFFWCVRSKSSMQQAWENNSEQASMTNE